MAAASWMDRIFILFNKRIALAYCAIYACQGIFQIKYNTMPTYQLSDKQVSTSISDETVILQFDSGEYYSLNEVGSFIWNLLQEHPHSLTQIIEAVCSNFDIDAANCDSDVQELLQDLENEKLISKTP